MTLTFSLFAVDRKVLFLVNIFSRLQTVEKFNREETSEMAVVRSRIERDGAINYVSLFDESLLV